MRSAHRGAFRETSRQAERRCLRVRLEPGREVKGISWEDDKTVLAAAAGKDTGSALKARAKI